MPQILIPKFNKSLVVEQGANLMDELLKAGLPVASSCDGDGVCGKCRIKILKGAENLGKRNEIEIFLMEQNSYSTEFRISCQTQVLGDIEVDATYW